MKNFGYLYLFFILILLSSCKKNEASSEKPIYVEILDDEARKILDEKSPIHILDSSFQWVEGPVWLEKEKKLLFSDVPHNKIYEYTEQGKIKEYLYPSGYTGTTSRTGEIGSNGLAIIDQKDLIICQHGNRQIVKMKSSLGSPKPEFETIADQYNGKKLNSPNDVTIGEDNLIYFTDPHYGLEHKSHSETNFNGVYRVHYTTKKVELLVDSLTGPNGIALSPDFKKLYIANSDEDKPYLYVYDHQKGAPLTNGKIAFDFSSDKGGIPDGFIINKDGYIFSSGPKGLWIINPQHKAIALIHFPDKVSNCALDKDKNVLYVTNTSRIVSIDLK